MMLFVFSVSCLILDAKNATRGLFHRMDPRDKFKGWRKCEIKHAGLWWLVGELIADC